MTIKKLFAFLFYFDKIDNFDNELQGAVITDNGLVIGLFAYCAHLESLQLYDCHKVLGSFLEMMPITIKRLAFVMFINYFLSWNFFIGY